MSERIGIERSLIAWAIARTGRPIDELLIKFPKLNTWKTSKRPTLTFVELERLATETRTPLGFFFLSAPPPDDVPIPDFRTVADRRVTRMSVDLIDTLQAMQHRQAWCATIADEDVWTPLKFIESAKTSDDASAIATDILSVLKLPTNWSTSLSNTEQALSVLRERVESCGIFIAINGCVGNNTSRILDPEEFRGFVFADRFAPLIFVNGHDAKSAQLFTIMHELAHLWVGRSGVLSPDYLAPAFDATEELCNRVAAEALVPEAELSTVWYSYSDLPDPFVALSKRYKVSPVVIGRRLVETSLVSRTKFFDFYNAYTSTPSPPKKSSGGSFYNNQNFRIGKRFMRLVGRAAEDGRITFTEAYRLTGLNNVTFEKYLQRIGAA